MEDYQEVLINLLPETCKRRISAGETPGSVELGLAAQIAEKCLAEQMRELGIPKKSFGSILFYGCVYILRLPIEQHIHDKICGCQKPSLMRNPRQEFTAKNIELHKLPTKKEPWTNGDLTGWTVASGSERLPVTEVRFYRNQRYVGSISLSVGEQWSLYCLINGQGWRPTRPLPFKNYEAALKTFIAEVS